MLVSVVIPAWNLWRFTSACLKSLAASSPPGSLEVIVVDNGSSDSTAKELQPLGSALFGEAFKRVRLESNQGFARACNQGAKAVEGDFVFFLNNDTTLSPGWLEPLMASFANGRTGAAGPLLLYPDGRLQHCGIYFNPFQAIGHLYNFFPGDHPLLRKKRPLQAITGAALMLPRALLAKTGGFCEDYKNGFEDLDLCFRVRKLGYKLSVAPDSIIYHHVSQTPGRFDHDRDNAEIMRSRWASDVKPDLHLLGGMDGYEMHLDRGLAVWLQTRPEASRRLAAKLNAAEPLSTQLTELLRAEPLWPEGWLMLTDTLEKEGNAAEAFARGLDCLALFPLPEMILKLNALAHSCGTLAPRAAETEKWLPLELSDAEKDKLHLKAQLALRSAWDKGDARLAGIMENWLLNAQ